jgi:7-keto-8-aminopelargonate synthetase-like enzyme
VNLGRAFVYTTNLPASTAAGAMASLDVMRDEPDRQHRLRRSAVRIRQSLPGAFGLADSPIIPVILGNEEAALSAASTLRDLSLLVLPVRPPTVPKRTSRLRLTVSCDHTDEEIDRLIAAVRQLGPLRPTEVEGDPAR